MLGEWLPALRSFRREEIDFARLRIGHTWLTHAYLLKGEKLHNVFHVLLNFQYNTFFFSVLISPLYVTGFTRLKVCVSSFILTNLNLYLISLGKLMFLIRYDYFLNRAFAHSLLLVILFHIFSDIIYLYVKYYIVMLGLFAYIRVIAPFVKN